MDYRRENGRSYHRYKDGSMSLCRPFFFPFLPFLCLLLPRILLFLPLSIYLFYFLEAHWFFVAAAGYILPNDEVKRAFFSAQNNDQGKKKRVERGWGYGELSVLELTFCMAARRMSKIDWVRANPFFFCEYFWGKNFPGQDLKKADSVK